MQEEEEEGTAHCTAEDQMQLEEGMTGQTRRV